MDRRPAAHGLPPACGMTPGGRATGRFCGPRLFDRVMGRSNSCAWIGGHSHSADHETGYGNRGLGAGAGTRTFEIGDLGAAGADE